MLKKLFLLALVVQFYSCDVLQEAMGEVLSEPSLTTAEVAAGLKQALEFGITEGALKLSQKDGYFKSQYKIPLPPEAQKVTQKLENIPLWKDVENVIVEKINRGAEDAAKEAAPIFKKAITSMSFSDAWGILTGGKDAATQYLEQATYNELYGKFNPVIVTSLDKFNARTYWGDAVGVYNKIPFVDKANPDLDDYVTKEALDGLFSMVAKKELDIRNNINARTTDLLRKVFAKQD